MKTVDLIPFILLELNENDQYGLEIIKNIETKTEGNVVIKQPTLYTVLKKLEKSKFISSYWLDSEIGGKRHYYKLTDFGKIQVSTLPSFNELLLALNNEETELDLLETNSQQPLESVIDSNIVFSDEIANNSIDTATEGEINLQNTAVLKENGKADENFAENINVAKFTEKNKNQSSININEVYNNSKNNLLPELNIDKPIDVENGPINYVDYKNIKKDENYIYSREISKKIITKNIFVSLAILLLIVLCNVVVNFTGGSPIFYVFSITSLIFAIFYPVITLLKAEKIRNKYLTTTYCLNVKKQIYINLFILLFITVTVLFLNIAIGNNSFVKIFTPSNFNNFYAPIILSCTGFLNVFISRLIINKNK